MMKYALREAAALYLLIDNGFSYLEVRTHRHHDANRTDRHVTSYPHGYGGEYPLFEEAFANWELKASEAWEQLTFDAIVDVHASPGFADAFVEFKNIADTIRAIVKAPRPRRRQFKIIRPAEDDITF